MKAGAIKVFNNDLILRKIYEAIVIGSDNSKIMDYSPNSKYHKPHQKQKGLF